MQVLVCLLWLLTATAGAAYAQGQVQSLEITDYGLYTLDREISGRDSQGISLGTASNIKHTATQRTVPAQIGATFGFRYRVVGRPEGATVDLKKVIVFPSPGLLTPTSSTRVPKAEFNVEAKIGETNSELYTLEDNFELMPGIWTLEMWQGNRKLVSQSFKLDKQGEKAEPEKAEREKPDPRRPQTTKPERREKPLGEGL
jgi:hypothetical protein